MKELHNKYNDLSPLGIGYFYGKVDEMFPAVPRFIFGITKNTPLDRQDPNRVFTFAKELSAKLA